MGAVTEANMSCKMYLANTLPAKASAAGCARLVETNAMRASFGMPASAWRLPLASCGFSASVWRLPLTACQRLLAGGMAKTSRLVTATGSTGGLLGGGGMPGGLLGSPCWREISVRVWSPLLELEENSQQGSMLCPEGACSSWKVSVPGGRALLRS